MTDNYFDSEEYSKIDFTKTKIKKGEYDNCTFLNCNFEGIHASNIQFVECEFIVIFVIPSLRILLLRM